MIRIDTAADFLAVIQNIKPVYIHSKTDGPILVPCVTTLLVRPELVRANVYNPNTVPEEKMDLLRQSVVANGFCFPVVTIWDEEQGCFVIIDGAHRRLISGSDYLDLDYLPVVVLAHDITKRMVATVQFNKARGVHQVDVDAELVRSLVGQGLADEEIASRLGMELESVHRYKQITGVAELFRNATFSRSWGIVEMED
jgi:ParB-like chromosome segregation protein Spo0J